MNGKELTINDKTVGILSAIWLCVLVVSVFLRQLVMAQYVYGVVGLLGIIGIAFLTKRRPHFRIGTTFFLILFLLWSIPACLLSSEPYTSITAPYSKSEGLIPYAFYFIVFIIATQLKTRKLINIVLIVHAVSATVLTTLSTLSLPIGKLMRVIQPMFDHWGAFLNSNHYGYYIATSLPVIVWLMLQSDKIWQQIIYALMLIPLSIAMVHCTTMGCLLAVFLTLLCLTIITLIFFRNKTVYLLVALAVIALTTAIASIGVWDIGSDVAGMFDDFRVLIMKVLGIQASDMKADEFERKFNNVGSARGVLWKAAAKTMLQYPLFGCGPDNYDKVFESFGARNRTHNEVLHYGATTGIPSMLFYLCAVASPFVAAVRQIKTIDYYKVLSLMPVLAYFISSIFGNTMYYTTPYFFIFLGICWSVMINKTGED